MVAENFANFATTLLVSPNPLTVGGTSLVCTTGQGALFPAGNFVATLGGEILYVTTRSGDTFSGLIRGYEGSTAVSHAAGETLQQCSTAGNWKHLWANVADTLAPQVPPVQLGGTPSAYDNEFESAAGWTLYPAPSGGTIFNAGTTLKSHLLLCRLAGDNTTYTAYIPYPVDVAAVFTAMVSQAVDLGNAASAQAQLSFFISDQANPTAGPDTGNRYKINTTISTTASGGVISSPQVARVVTDSSGAATTHTPSLAFAIGAPLFFRVGTAGGGLGIYAASVGNGIVYWPFGSTAGLSFTPRSIGFTFHSYLPSGGSFAHTVAIDFLRINTNPSASLSYGN